MPFVSVCVGFLSLGIWLYLVFARGAFWRLRPFDDDVADHSTPSQWPRVIAIVPARNEADTIGQTMGALLAQDYPGRFSIVVVDDHSDDATSEIAKETACEKDAESRATVHRAPELPAGWAGKVWALNEGVSLAATPPETADTPQRTDSPPVPSAAAVSSRAQRGTCFPCATEKAASEEFPAYLWFTDADVVHAPHTLRRLVARAESNKLDLVSLMVLLQANTLPERALIPAFLFFFLKLYPPRWTADRNSGTAGAAGGCILLRREALERIGGLAAIRGEVIDDCALARAVKRSGGRIWMGLTRASVSIRAYRTFGEIREMIARLAFTQLHYSVAFLFAALAGMFLTYFAPVTLPFTHNWLARLLGLAALLLMLLLFLPTVRFYRLSPLWAPLLPFAGLFYSYATILSAVRYWLGRGAQWKGRSQAQRLV